MALPPDTPNAAFLREVDENLRREQIETFAKRYGKWIVAAVVLFLAAVGGWLYWQNRQQVQAAEQSEELHRIFGDIAGGRLDTVPQRLEQLERSGSDSVSASARLTRAAVALERNDRARALALYRQVAADEGLPQLYREVGTIRATAIEFDALKPEDIIARLEPMARPGHPWFGSAGEMTALALIRRGQNARAGRLFASMAADRQVPSTLRSRAVQIAGTLGVDASGSLPAFDQQD